MNGPGGARPHKPFFLFSPCQALPQDFPAPWGVHRNSGVPQQRERKAGSAQGLMNHPGAPGSSRALTDEGGGCLSSGNREPAGRRREQQKQWLRGAAPHRKV